MPVRSIWTNGSADLLESAAVPPWDRRVFRLSYMKWSNNRPMEFVMSRANNANHF